MTATELSSAVTAPLCGSTAATPMTGRRDCQPLPRLRNVSRPRASRLTARRLCWGLTACHDSRSCPVERRHGPQSSMPSTSSSVTARICAVAHSLSARLRWRSCWARSQSWHPAQRTHRRRWAYRVRLCVSARCWGHRVEEGRQRLPVRSVPRLDQGPQSGQHRRAAGAQRSLAAAGLETEIYNQIGKSAQTCFCQ
jgi:hypothetical protein